MAKHAGAIGFLIAGIVVLLGIVFFAAVSEKSNRGREQSETDQENVVEERALEFTSEVIEDEGEGYEAQVQYPLVSGIEGAGEINEALEEFARAEVAQFAARARTAREDAASPPIQSEFLYTYETSFAIPEDRLDGYVNVVFEAAEYLGGAHPNTTFTTFVFDERTGEDIELSNVFRKDSEYLSLLSEASRTKLLEKMGENAVGEMVRAGTEARSENFDAFILHRNSIEIIFNAYQVAPYAAGAQRVEILYPYLEDVLAI